MPPYVKCWETMASSSYNLLASTTERYLMVVHTLYHKVNVTQRKLYVAIGLVWLIGPLYQAVASLPTRYLKDGVKCVSSVG